MQEEVNSIALTLNGSASQLPAKVAAVTTELDNLDKASFWPFTHLASLAIIRAVLLKIRLHSHTCVRSTVLGCTQHAHCTLQAIREELRGAASSRDDIDKSTAEQAILALSIQEARAALAQLQCQHEDLKTLHASDICSQTDEDTMLEVTFIRGLSMDLIPLHTLLQP